MCVIEFVAEAPCQCSSSGGIHTVSPALINCGAYFLSLLGLYHLLHIVSGQEGGCAMLFVLQVQKQPLKLELWQVQQPR